MGLFSLLVIAFICGSTFESWATAKTLVPIGASLSGIQIDGEDSTLKVTRAVSHGGYGVVYEAESPKGYPYIVKVLALKEKQLLVSSCEKHRRYIENIYEPEKNLHKIYYSGLAKVNAQDEILVVVSQKLRADLGSCFGTKLSLTLKLELPFDRKLSILVLIMDALARAVQHLHEKKFTHGDIGLANVLVGDSFYLSDFDEIGPLEGKRYSGRPVNGLLGSKNQSIETDRYQVGLAVLKLASGYSPKNHMSIGIRDTIANMLTSLRVPEESRADSNLFLQFSNLLDKLTRKDGDRSKVIVVNQKLVQFAKSVLGPNFDPQLLCRK